MPDREKVMWSLARCSCGVPDACSDCCYDNWPSRICVQHLTNDALALLKAQEPRVMTLEEVRQERICWIEDADDGMMTRLFPATMFGTGKYASGLKSYMFLAQKPWAVDVNNYEWWYIIADYEQTWRCWTSRPTDEQREAIPWLT